MTKRDHNCHSIFSNHTESSLSLCVCLFVWVCVCLHLNVIPFVVWGKKLLICWEEEEIKRFPGLLTNHFHSLFFISPHASTFVFFVNWHRSRCISQILYLYLSECENHISLSKCFYCWPITSTSSSLSPPMHQHLFSL